MDWERAVLERRAANWQSGASDALGFRTRLGRYAATVCVRVTSAIERVARALASERHVRVAVKLDHEPAAILVAELERGDLRAAASARGARTADPMPRRLRRVTNCRSGGTGECAQAESPRKMIDK